MENMPLFDTDRRIRTAAFDWLTKQVDRYGDVLPWKLLKSGFEFDGKRIHVVSMQGIFKPRMLDLPLSIRSSPAGPYDDQFGPDGLLRYDYRDSGPDHRENVGLRRAMREGTPLIYFFGIVPGKYLAAWPVFVVDDDVQASQFSVAVDDARQVDLLRPREAEPGLGREHDPPPYDEGAEGRRAYVTSVVRRRLHQRAFRERVLDAYRRQCSLCQLRHEELLDAAHIIPDSAEEGTPDVTNGLALCKLHHAAFDRNFLGIRPDYRIEIRPDLLDEEDGPTLLHAIQGMHGEALIPPRKQDARPDPDRLAVRYEEFRAGLQVS